MSTKPEALRLAAQLDDTEGAKLHLLPYAAAELRRLHAQAAQDEALLRQALEALESCDGYAEQLELIVYSLDDTGTHDVRAKAQSTIAILRERLAETANDLTRCPNCGGPADNGHDREVPPNPYWCSKCTES